MYLQHAYCVSEQIHLSHGRQTVSLLLPYHSVGYNSYEWQQKLQTKWIKFKTLALDWSGQSR